MVHLSSFLFFSLSLHLCFLSFFLGTFLRFLVPSLLPRLLYLAPFAFVPTEVVGDVPVVFRLCMFVHFGFPYLVLWLYLYDLALSLSLHSPVRSLLGRLSVSFPFRVFTFLFPGFSVWFLLWLCVLYFS